MLRMYPLSCFLHFNQRYGLSSPQSPDLKLSIINTLLCDRPCVPDVGMAITNLRVVCKLSHACVSAFAIIFLEIVKLLLVWTLCIAGYAKDAIVAACHCTSDGQEHKIIWLAGPEQDMIFHLRVTACREHGSHCHDKRLAWVASRGQGTSYSNLFVSKVLGAN